MVNTKQDESGDLLIRVENPAELYGILNQLHDNSFNWTSGHSLMEHMPELIPDIFRAQGDVVLRAVQAHRKGYVVWFPLRKDEDL